MQSSVHARVMSSAHRLASGLSPAESVGELIDVPKRSPSRGPPYWKSVVLRKKALGDAA